MPELKWINEEKQQDENEKKKEQNYHEIGRLFGGDMRSVWCFLKYVPHSTYTILTTTTFSQTINYGIKFFDIFAIIVLLLLECGFRISNLFNIHYFNSFRKVFQWTLLE